MEVFSGNVVHPVHRMSYEEFCELDGPEMVMQTEKENLWFYLERERQKREKQVNYPLISFRSLIHLFQRNK